MKTYLKYILLLVSTLFVLYSCESEDDVYKVRTYHITYKVYCNTKDVPVRLYRASGEMLIIKNHFEESYTAKSGDKAGVLARCDDKTNLITVEVYVNGRLKDKNIGNSYVGAGVTLE